jgi:hypothetical protein
VDLQCDYGQGFFIGQPMTAKQVGESLTSVPYVKGHGRTAMSTLWERAAHEPVPPAVDAELTTSAIEKAGSQKNAEWETVKEVALAIQAKKLNETTPPLGSSPMAPRLVKPALVDLPTIVANENKLEKKPRKKSAAKKKRVSEKLDPKPSSVP